MSIMSSHEVGKLLSELVDKLAEKSANAGISAEQLAEVLIKAQLTGAEAMRQSLKPENADHPHISAFFTEADRAKYGAWDQKPKLRAKTFFCGIEEDAERLTSLEIESYNRITEDREARGGRWTATVRRRGHKDETLTVNVPCETVDQRMDLPPLTLILHELNGGQSTEDLYSLLKQIDKLKVMLVERGSTPAELEAALLTG